MIEKRALAYALDKHKGQKRKLGGEPYLVHPISVALIVSRYTYDEEIIAAALLHDCLEDTDATYEEIVSLFGERVANLVSNCSEKDKSLGWKERKEKVIDEIRDLDDDSKLILMGDKIDNLHSMLENLNEKMWDKFNAGFEQQKWYYESILRELAPAKHEAAYDILVHLVEVIFGKEKN